MTLSGNIIDGMGTAKYWVKKIYRAFLKKTDMKLYLGTLNIKLMKDYTINPDFIIYKEEYGGTENILVKRCKIFNENAFIVRAEKNQNGTGDYGLDVIEIVSITNFREKYKLKNSKLVEITI